MSQYPRSVKENYGVSTVELVELQMTDDLLVNLSVDSQEVQLPVLNLKKHDLNCHCYAIIERLKQTPVTMIDLLYSYQELSLENPSFRDIFMRNFTRSYINQSSMKTPGVILTPKDRRMANSFASAIKNAVEECVGKKVIIARTNRKEQVEIKKNPDPEKVVQDGIVLEFIKDFYEIISGKKVSRPTDPIIKRIDCSISKDAIFIKSGAIITGNVQSNRYLASFQTQTYTDEENLENEKIKDILSVYITGVDDQSLMTNSEYFKKFENIVLSSHILEALSVVNQEKIPLLAYCGELNMPTERIRVNKNVEKYINKINSSLFYSRGQNNGEYRY